MNGLLIGKLVFLEFLSIILFSCGSSYSSSKQEISTQGEDIDTTVARKEIIQTKSSERVSPSEEIIHFEKQQEAVFIRMNQNDSLKAEDEIMLCAMVDHLEEQQEAVLIKMNHNDSLNTAIDIMVLNEDFPEFPLPPPTSSAEGRMPKDIFSDCANLLDVDKKLTNALFQCGYENVSYFYIPTGFALVTQLEQIDPLGFSLGDYRWSITTIPNFKKGFSLAEYFRLLVGAKSGYYRCFVFLITQDNLIKSDEEPDIGEVSGWVNSGASNLPESIGLIENDGKHSFYVYVYEFEKKKKKEEVAKISSNISCKDHLIRSKIWAQLVQ